MSTCNINHMSGCGSLYRIYLAEQLLKCCICMKGVRLLITNNITLPSLTPGLVTSHTYCSGTSAVKLVLEDETALFNAVLG